MSDSALASRLYAARKAVGDSGKTQRTIRTMPRKGVRFVGTVRAATYAKGGRRAAAPPPDRPAIAVLPFVNMSGDPAHDHFCDGMSEDIITALSRLRWFFVIARNSSFAYKGKSVHLKQIAEELGVGYVIEGSVRQRGDRVRVTAQLNDVATGSHLWAERYDRAIADIFAVEDEITDAIVATIEPRSMPRRIFAGSGSRPRAWTPGIWWCGQCRIFGG